MARVRTLTTTGPEFDCTFAQAVRITFPGIANDLIRKRMMESGMLIAGGFVASADGNTVVMMVEAGVSPVDAAERLTIVIRRLVATGQIRLSV